MGKLPEQAVSHKSALLYHFIMHTWFILVGCPTKVRLWLIFETTIDHIFTYLTIVLH